MAEETNGRISVSRADLRADLAELELRMTRSIADLLKEKADAKDLTPLSQSVESLNAWRIRAEQGEFTQAQRDAVSGWISKAFSYRSREAWAGWERKIAVSGMFVGLLGAAGGIAAAVEVFVH